MCWEHIANKIEDLQMPKYEDLTGKTIGYWEIINRAPDKILESGQKRVMWNCKCLICENMTELSTTNLKNNSPKCDCYKTYMSKNMLIRTCQECGKPFWGGPRAFFCQKCRNERRKEQSRNCKIRKKSGNVIPLGSTIKCLSCGTEIIKNSGAQKYCPLCAAKHLKEIDNIQSKSWARLNPEKYKESKKKFSQKRYAEGVKIDTLMSGVSWDPARQQFKSYININGKQIILIYTSFWEWAFVARIVATRLKLLNILDKTYIDNIGEMCRTGRLKLEDYVKYTPIEKEIYEQYLSGSTQTEIARERSCSRQWINLVLANIKSKNNDAQTNDKAQAENNF